MRGSVPYLKMDRMTAVPTVIASMWGQLRWKPGNYSTTGDRLAIIGKDDTGAVVEMELATTDDTDAIAADVAALPTDLILNNTLETSGTNPTAVVQSAAGNTATASIDFGNDISGRVTVGVSGTGITTGQMVRVTFASARPDSNYAVIVSPGSSLLAPLGYYVTDRQTTYFALAVTTAPSSGNSLQFSYLVIEDA